MSQPEPFAARPTDRTARRRWHALRRLAGTAPARLLAVCAVCLALAAPAWADVSRDQAAAAAQRQTGGRVLSVDKTESGRRTVWRVKVVTPRGEVRVVFIDADAGRGG
ncbi:MAG: PepSY domain-containing protein [Burkholderiaceae bacterium]